MGALSWSRFPLFITIGYVNPLDLYISLVNNSIDPISLIGQPFYHLFQHRDQLINDQFNPMNMLSFKLVMSSA